MYQNLCSLIAHDCDCNKSAKKQTQRKSNTRGTVVPNAYVGRDGGRQAILDFRGRGKSLELVTTKIYSMVNKGVVTSTSAAEGLYAFSFALADVADYTSYTSVWDQYRIVELDLTLIPVTLASAPATGPAYAFCYVAPDYDDATTPANTTAMLSYSNVAVVGPSEKYQFRIQPAVDIATTTSAAAGITGSMSARSPWLDCSSPSVSHYGLKAAITQSTSTNLTQWVLFARYVIEFRRQQ